MNNTAKYIERFEQLIRVLQDLPPHEKRKHFNIREWAEQTDCGTTCCAAGFAGLDSWFRRRGFKLTKPKHIGGLGNIGFKGNVGWEALHEFFGLGEPKRDLHGDAIFSEVSAPIFAEPASVAQVIKAAKARIKELKARPALE
jgi:hypothetical protein